MVDYLRPLIPHHPFDEDRIKHDLVEYFRDLIKSINQDYRNTWTAFKEVESDISDNANDAANNANDVANNANDIANNANDISDLQTDVDTIVDRANHIVIPPRSSANAQPTLASGELKMWHDADANAVYLLYNDPTEGHVKVQLT